jgi:hypothetical protein
LSGPRPSLASRRLRPIVLLGPQGVQRTLGSVVDAAGVTGDIAAITAGWEEREEEMDRLRAHLDRRVIGLQLYARGEEVFREDPEFARAYRERRLALRELADLYRVRLDNLKKALNKLMKRTDARPELIEPERDAAFDDLRRLDAHQRRRIADIHAEFEARWRPHEHESVMRHRREIAALMRSCEALTIAGGNVAVLVNRLRLFDVKAHVGDLAVFAWSAGAMACSEEIVLFHDDPPQGQGNPEVFGDGLGLVRGVLPLPHASKRLSLHDRNRVGIFARRFEPLVCVVLDPGHGLRWDGHAWHSAAGGARRLTTSGEVVEMFAP